MDIVMKIENGKAHVNIEQKYVYHSPTGFNWGYGGSGPADLALNILAMFVPYEEAFRLHQKFKWEYIANIPPEGGIIREEEIRKFIAENS